MTGERRRARTPERRDFLKALASAAGMVLTGCATTKTAEAGRAEQAEGEHGEAEVTPGEDLMQEHGVLERILLVYEEATRRIERAEPFNPAVIANAAGIIRSFVEDYHEKLEEEFIFPRLQSAGREVELVAVLLRQHQRGRDLTDGIVRTAGGGPIAEVAPLLRSFSRMYRPHAAREDTVLFPAFREVIGASGYRELGEQFEEKEHALFGEHGFQDVVARVAELERTLGIEDLASFTPT